ncbi:MAG: SDR family NAD(P)-dependent oxidoreductase [Actinobacteria bacterium]|nr:SDR family NAD(P)-dependent oxidoreductase [Actinomycetota bacterium]
MGICDGRVAIVTGAGGGIGRAHALTLAAEGAKVVVNDLGGSVSGEGASAGPAQQVVDEILALGGEAVANTDDISDFDGAGRLVQQAVDAFGGLDVLICNAGILRDRMIANMTVEEWDAVIRVHLRGAFCPVRHAAGYWRDRAKAGETNDARIVLTSSTSGIYGNVGQTNYGAAKAGIAALTIIASAELARYGVTVNAIAPAALTRMTENLGGSFEPTEEVKAQMDPQWVANVVTWLASPESKDWTGRVIETSGNRTAVAHGWTRGPNSKTPADTPAGVRDVLVPLLEAADPPVMLGP